MLYYKNQMCFITTDSYETYQLGFLNLDDYTCKFHTIDDKFNICTFNVWNDQLLLIIVPEGNVIHQTGCIVH